MDQLLWVIPGFPLLGFMVLVLGGRRLGEPVAGWFATAMVGGSFAATVAVFVGLVGRDAALRLLERTIPSESERLDMLDDADLRRDSQRRSKCIRAVRRRRATSGRRPAQKRSNGTR